MSKKVVRDQKQPKTPLILAQRRYAKAVRYLEKSKKDVSRWDIEARDAWAALNALQKK